MAITSNSAGIYLFKINNGSSTIREICSKSSIKKTKRRQCLVLVSLFVAFGQISHITPVLQTE